MGGDGVFYMVIVLVNGKKAAHKLCLLDGNQKKYFF